MAKHTLYGIQYDIRTQRTNMTDNTLPDDITKQINDKLRERGHLTDQPDISFRIVHRGFTAMGYDNNEKPSTAFQVRLFQTTSGDLQIHSIQASDESVYMIGEKNDI